jgi:hypothetical protein
MGTLNNWFFPYPKSKKPVISLVFALKGGVKNIVFQTALISKHILSLQECQLHLSATSQFLKVRASHPFP